MAALPARFKRFHNLTIVAAAAASSAKSFNARTAVANHLKAHRIDDARRLFNQISCPDVYLSTQMLSSYLEDFRFHQALALFDEIPVKDTPMWNFMIRACVASGNLEMGLKLFDEMPHKNVISWTTVITGLLKFGMVREAEGMFWDMPERDTAVWNAMVHGLFYNGRVEEATRLFQMMPHKNVISCTTMITGLDRVRMTDEALLSFKEMVGIGFRPSSCTLTCIVTACANAGRLEFGVQLHGQVWKLGSVFDAHVMASLITFYGSCGKVEECGRVFSEKVHHNVVVWTSLLTGYGANGKHENAVRVFGNMVRFGVVPNQSSFAGALSATREMEMVDWGTGIHCASMKLGLESDVFVGNSLVVLYMKCGSIQDGVAAFQEIVDKNVVSWNAVIVGCAQHGHGEWAMAFLTHMTKAGLSPDEITFTGLLSSCSHSGMLHKGRHIFECLRRLSSVKPCLEHYACMVDILCRSGRLDEAEDLVKKMPMEPNLSIWLALLSGCRSQSKLEIAERAAKHIRDIDPHCGAASVLMSNIYALAGRWADVARVRRNMRKMGTLRQPGYSWVTQRGVRHTFVSGDKSHPLSKEIYKKLEWLRVKLKENGYVSDERCSLHDVEEEHKGELLSSHSERLAICFALITTPEGSTITVMKNLRTCEDCHSAIKLTAMIIRRKIVIRDSTRFHHFTDGFCSCGDYW